jgi:hypothetical protein
VLLVTETTKETILNAIQSLPRGWYTREDIALALGKKQLNPSDKARLEALAVEGKLQRKREPAGKGNVIKFVYRLKG